MVNPGFTGTITASADFSPEAQYKVINFYYDHNGLRTRKVVWDHGVTETYDYTLHGKLITHMTKRTVDENGNGTTVELHYFYDAQFRPAYVNYNDSSYRYVHNFQDDIIGIIDSNNCFVVKYKYGSWGNVIGIDGEMKETIGIDNPFRYRCYLWDEEINAYYLRNRLYIPRISRFIEPDSIPDDVSLDTPFDRNQFSYCFNSPNDFKDPNGDIGILTSMLIGGAINMIVGVAVDYILCEKQDPFDAVRYFLEGAFMGGASNMFRGAGLAAKVGNKIFGALAAAEVSGIEYTLECMKNDREYSNVGLVVTMACGGAASFTGYNSGYIALDMITDTVNGFQTGIMDKIIAETIVDNAITPYAGTRKKKARGRVSGNGTNTMAYLKKVYDPLLGCMREIVCYA